jgi:hypothetical protein
MTLPERDSNHELHKTQGLAWANVRLARNILTDPDVIKDPDDCEIVGFRESLEILADRLDDHCCINDRADTELFKAQLEAARLREKVSELENENARLSAELARLRATGQAA